LVFKCKKEPRGWVWWLTPVIPAVWKAEIGGSWLKVSQAKVRENLQTSLM
jgi:hypothetical protein